MLKDLQVDRLVLLPLSKSYFQIDSAAGDWFLSTVSVQGYQDTDATDKDEENMLMSHDIAIPDATGHDIIFNTGTFQGWDSCLDACENYGDGSITEVDSPTAIPLDTGDVLFENVPSNQFLTPKNGEQQFFIYVHPVSKIIYCMQIDYNGIIMSMEVC